MTERATEWVCGACGKHFADRHDHLDVACYMGAVECYVDSFSFDEVGRLTGAEGVGDALER